MWLYVDGNGFLSGPNRKQRRDIQTTTTTSGKDGTRHPYIVAPEHVLSTRCSTGMGGRGPLSPTTRPT